jgi:cell division septal protein FtsQ
LKGLKRTLLVIVLLSAAAFLSWEALKVRDIAVAGTRSRLPAEVAMLSGIGLGDSLLTLDKELAKAGIESDPYFKYDDIEIDWPSGIIIRVTERIPKTYILHLGSMIIMDEAGFVLEIGRNLPHADLVQVTGLQVTAYLVGEEVQAENQDQVFLYSRVYEAFEKEGLTGEIKEIIITQSLTARVVTGQGITVDIGTSDNLQRKIMLTESIVESLNRMYSPEELNGTSLDVSTGEFGDFNPD